MITSIYEVKVCPECAGANLAYIHERDQVVCRECGLVYEPLTPKEERRFERVSQIGKKPASPSKNSPAKTAKKHTPHHTPKKLTVRKASKPSRKPSKRPTSPIAKKPLRKRR